MNTAQITIAILGSAGFFSVVGAIITGFLNKRKLGADATEIITKAASGVVERIESDNARLRTELDTERQERKAEQAEFRQIIAQHTRTLQLHAAWDHLAVERLAEAGIDLPAPPPLYPPDGPAVAARHLGEL